MKANLRARNAAKRLDLRGRVFGRLTALAPAGNARGRTTWTCRCACGKTKVFRTSHLVSGRSTSCGCAFTAMLKARRPTHRLNLTGQVFGDLEVLGRAKNIPCLSKSFPNGMAAHVCRCRPCRRVVIVKTADLTRRKNPTRHCGCRWLKPAVTLVSPPPTISAPVRPVAAPTRPLSPGNGNGQAAEQLEVVWNGQRASTPGAAQRALDRFHDEHSPLGKVRRVAWPVEEDDEAGGVLFDFWPFDEPE